MDYTKGPGEHRDVFISHANDDKPEYVNKLKESIDKLRVKVFYDKDTLEWGDNWKEKLQEGIERSEFAIIVISEKFFGREWTEKELNGFLTRQNSTGQKIILPILHNITIAQLKEKYPSIADIQALDSKNYSCDEIALLFARQLIVRLRSLSETVGNQKQESGVVKHSFRSLLKQIYDDLVSFRNASNRSDTGKMNQLVDDLNDTMQNLYTFYEFNRSLPGPKGERAEKADKVIQKYNTWVNYLRAAAENSNMYVLTGFSFQDLMRTVIDTLHDEGVRE